MYLIDFGNKFLNHLSISIFQNQFENVVLKNITKITKRRCLSKKIKQIAIALFFVFVVSPKWFELDPSHSFFGIGILFKLRIHAAKPSCQCVPCLHLRVTKPNHHHHRSNVVSRTPPFLYYCPSSTSFLCRPSILLSRI